MKNWLPFEEAREYVRKSNVRTQDDYRNFIKNNSSFPSHPERNYRDFWVSWGDWTGEKKVLRQSRFLSFEKAREYVRKMNIKDQKEWYLIRKNMPSFIPCNPHVVYKNEWLGFGDWSGNNNVRGGQRQHSVNENFFDTWTSNMAYVLGFWFADGCICYGKSGYRFRLTQHKKDKYLIEHIARVMGAEDYPIQDSHEFYCDLSINSKKIYHDIIRLGGKRKKSMDIEFPVIPQKYLADFVRGYFDGDGCIHLTGKGCVCSFVSGSKRFLDGLNNILKTELIKYNNGFNISGEGVISTIKERVAPINGKYWKFRENYRLTLSTNRSRMLRDFMYASSGCIRLERKYEKFSSIGEITLRFGNKIKNKRKAQYGL